MQWFIIFSSNQKKQIKKNIKYIYYRFWLHREDFNCFKRKKQWSSLGSAVGAPVGIVSTNFTLIFSVKTGKIKNLLNITQKKKKKHHKIFMLAKSKLDSIETLVSQALIDMEISHEKFNAIIREKKNMRGWKKMWGMSAKNKKIWEWIVSIQKT